MVDDATGEFVNVAATASGEIPRWREVFYGL
jgi:hypothetical protein